MRIAELVLKYVQALAWPGVALALVWLLRAQLRAAADRVTRVETPVGAVDFAASARDVLQQARSAAQDTARDTPAWRHAPYPESLPARTGDGPDPARTPAGDQAPPSLRRPPGAAERERPGPPEDTSGPPGLPDHGAPGPVTGPVPGGSVRLGDGGPAHVQWTRLREARDAVDATPAGAVAMAWDALRTLCAERITAAGLAPPSGPAEFGAGLTALGISPHTVQVLEVLRRLNADALRVPENVTPSAARDFVDACSSAARDIDPFGRYRGGGRMS